MSIKDLFGKKSNKVLTKKDLNDLVENVESQDFISSEVSLRTKFIPKIDFSKPENFAKYGLAEKYYSDSYYYITSEYPYDGSSKEKNEWEYSASPIDLWIFENNYPRTTGYVVLNSGAIAASTVNNPLSAPTYDFDIMTNPQYVTFFGGPNTDPSVTSTDLDKQFAEQGGNSNIYDPSNNRESNLKLSGVSGNTIEFFCKVDDTTALTAGTNICLFDVWNGIAPADPDYSRFIVEYNDTNKFLVTYKSDTGGFERQAVATSTSITTSWTHFAITLEDSGVDCVVKAYADGELEQTATLVGRALGDATQKNLEGSIGAYMYGPTAALEGDGVTTGFGGYAGLYIDELRFWKTKRTSKDIGRHWFTQVNGGTNTDTSNTDLGIYYKFNEGIFDSLAIDSNDEVVLDYSGRLSNGTISNYTITVRSTGSAIDEHTTTTHTNTEFKDPIIHSTSPSVVSARQTLVTAGQSYDYKNNNSLYRSLPGWILEDDEGGDTTTLKNLTQVMASYFDNLYYQITEISSLKDVEYSNTKQGEQPHFFAKKILESTGLISPDLFVDATVLEEFASRDEDKSFTNKLSVLKNLIYQNVYNNIAHIYKSKGTEKSFRNLLRCFGVDEDLIRINLYADNADYQFVDNVRHTTVKKRQADFSYEAAHSAVIYQYEDPSDAANTRSFILSDPANFDYIPTTMEAEIMFPKDLGEDQPPETSYRTFLSSSLFGVHEANSANEADLSFHGTDDGNFQVYAVRESAYSKNAKFVLNSTGYGTFTLESDVYKNVYDGEKWSFAVRILPRDRNHEITDRADSTFDDYTLEFYGVNTTQNSVDQEFTLTQSISIILPGDALPGIRAAKRLYCGAHITDFTGVVLTQSDVKVNSIRYWYDYIDDDTVKSHAYDIKNIGRRSPDAPSNFGATSLVDGYPDRIQVPEIETLVLNWDFSNVSTSDGAGQFIVSDASSGSASDGTYDWFSTAANYKHTGRGDGFPASSTTVAKPEYLSTAKPALPETISSSDMINILSRDDETFTRDTKPITYFFAAEKSMYQTVSEEMMNMFSGVARFNELIGAPVNRYRQSYKNLEHLREIFFEREINDITTLERYVNFYKWLDSSISGMVEQLFPASANFSEGLNTVIESHILERSKYWNKMPTVENKSPVIEAAAAGMSELLYDWLHGHAPVTPLPGPEHDESCLWHSERAERTDTLHTLATGDAAVDADREAIRRSVTRSVKGNSAPFYDPGTATYIESEKRFYDGVTSTTYEGNTYAVRRLSKPYNFAAEKTTHIRGGVNYSESKKDILNKFRSSTKITTGAQGVEIQGSKKSDPSCLDATVSSTPKFKNATSVSVTDSTGGAYDSNLKGEKLLPFNYHFSAPNASALGAVPDSLNRTNMHSDSYGELNETPMQGPFTDQWVGGNQHRHVTLTTTQQDLKRPELYIENANVLRHPHDFSTANYAARYTRDGLAKRPLNIANIKTTAGATEDVHSNELPQGNYTNHYEVVQAHGRNLQNRWFVKNEGIDAFDSINPSTFVTDTTGTGIVTFPLVDFVLPDRDKDKLGNSFGSSDHVFVERFSAPGSPAGMSRGSLDAESEQYSPYNTVNYRNLLGRQHLNHWHSDHADAFGYRDTFIHSSSAGSAADGSSTENVASWHKNNRNAITRMFLIDPDESDANHALKYGSENSFDNFHVGHQVPRSDWQYGWINSATGPAAAPTDTSTVHDRISGYASDYTNISINAASAIPASSTITYPDATTASISYVGLNDLLVDPIDLATGKRGYDCNLCGTECYTGSFYLITNPANDRNELNILLLTRNGPYGYSSWKQIRTGETKLVKAQRKNNIISVQDEPQVREVTSSSGVTFTYRDNRADTFKNYYEPASIWNKPMQTLIFNSTTRRSAAFKHTYANNLETFSNPNLINRLGIVKCEKQTYDRLLEMYKTEEPSDTKFNRLRYREIIYPKHRHTSLKHVRQRNNYSESETKIRNNPTGFFGFVYNQNKLHIRTFWKDSSEDRKRGLSSYNALGYSYSPSQYEVYKQKDSVWALDDYMEYVSGSMTLHTLGDLGHAGNARYNDWISAYSRITTREVTTTVFVSSGFWPTPPIPGRGFPAYSKTLSGGISYDDAYEGREVLESPCGTNKHQADEPVRIGTTGVSGYGARLFLDPESTREVGTSDELLIASSEALPDSTIGELTQPRPMGLVAELDPLSSRSRKTITNLSAEAPRPALQFLYNPYNRDLNEKGWSWRTGEISSNKPWFDSYEDYSEDIRLMGQNFGTLSEFRISQHMNFYVQEGSSNFRSENYNFLTLDGSNKRTTISGEAVETTSRLYSRMGMGINPGTKYPDYADVIAATPTTEDPYQFKLIKNNAYYYIGVPGEGYTRYREQNQFYASGTLTIDNSVNSNVIYSRTTSDNKNSYASENTGVSISGLPDSNRAPSSDWVPILPYNGCRSAALSFNTTCDSDDYIFCPLTQWGSSNVIDLSQTTDNQGGALTLSFWVKPSKNAMENCEYVGSTCMVNNPYEEGSTDLLKNPIEEIGIWLKCPTVTAGLFNGTANEGVGGLTFYMNPKVSNPNPLVPTSAPASENIFHFMSQVEATSNFVPTVLPTDSYSHIVLQIIPSTVYSTGPVTSPGKVMMWLNGERLYAVHPTSLSSGVNSAWSAVEPGSSYGGTTYGSGFTSNFAKMMTLVAGKNMVNTKREDKFKGEMDELSLFRGVLTTTSIANLYNSGAQTNVMEEFYNYRLSSVYLNQADINSHYGSTSPVLNLPLIAIPHVDYSIPAPTAAISPMLPELSIWWRMGVPFRATYSSVTRKYSDDFFDRHSHTDTPQHLFDIMDDHETKRRRIRITANAVKKLIPYNGFYPSQRTVQLGHLFKEDYFKTISKGLEDEDAFWDSQRLQSLLQGFFAPGILYNSIKSGVAVDWPAFTNETGNEPPNFGAKKTIYSNGYYKAVAPNWYDSRNNPYSSKTIPSSEYKANTEYFTEQPKFSSRGIPKNDAGFVILDEPNLRIPFEGLLAPESAVPREDSRSTSILDQSKLYTNITLDIGSYDCEGNDITLSTPGSEQESLIVKLRRGVTDYNGASGNDEIYARFYTDPSRDYHAIEKGISQRIAKELCQKINIDFVLGKTGWIAITDSSISWPELSVTGKIVEILRNTGLKELYQESVPKSSGRNTRVRLFFVGKVESEIDLSRFVGRAILLSLAVMGAFARLESIIQTRLTSPPAELIEISEQANIVIEQTLSSVAGEGSSYFRDILGERNVYSSLTNLGIFPLNENNAIDRQVDTSGVNVKKTIHASGGVSFSTVFPDSKPYEIFLMAPEYYTGSQLDVLQTKRYPSFEMKGNPKTDLYKMAMHNFLAEVPSFFLQNSTLTSFASAPEDQFKEMIKGHTYYMDVGLFKTEDFHMTISPNNKMLKPSGDTTNGRYFGPAFRYKDADKYNNAGELVADPSQAPYTPAYHYGKATARLSFTASDTRKYSLDEILGSLKVETFNEEAKRYFETVCRQQAALSTSGDTEVVNSNPLESPAYNAMMSLTSSVNVRGKSKVKTMGWGYLGADSYIPASAEDPTSSDKDAWVISTKFESPILNFLNEENVEKIKKMEDDVIDPEGIGMWSGYGSMPKSGQGIFLTIEEAFPESSPSSVTGSLVDVCGFNIRSKQIGKVANSKQISEAIVMIPFIDKKIPGRTVTFDNREVFLIDKGIYQSQKRNLSLGKPAVPRGSVPDLFNKSDIEKTSVSNMIEMMDKYYVPPKYNFAEYEDLSPFVMYFVEFTHTLNQKDLVDIWQGVMPGISKTAEKDVQSIVHDISPVEFFGGQDIPDDVRWMTFRVKPKGNNDYYDFYKKSLGDSRFTFDFNIGEEKPLYSYNWPYDFYSLVELSQIQVGTDIYNTDPIDSATNPVYGELPSITASKVESDPGAGIFDPPTPKRKKKKRRRTRTRREEDE